MSDFNALLIFRLANSYAKLRNKVFAQFGLTSGQIYILLYLMHHTKEKEINQTEIQQDLNLTHQTVTQMIGLLEKNGWITTGKSSIDRRCKTISLRSRAQQISSALAQAEQNADALFVEGMTDEEISQYTYLLNISAQNIKRALERDPQSKA